MAESVCNKRKQIGSLSGRSYPLGATVYHPLGATVYPEGVNFSIYSKSSTAMELLFFDDADDANPARTISLDPKANRTFHYWHIFVPEIKPGQLYGYRADGPYAPDAGQRFDPDKLLLDPYCRAVAVPNSYSRVRLPNVLATTRRRP